MWKRTQPPKEKRLATGALVGMANIIRIIRNWPLHDPFTCQCSGTGSLMPQADCSDVGGAGRTPLHQLGERGPPKLAADRRTAGGGYFRSWIAQQVHPDLLSKSNPNPVIP